MGLVEDGAAEHHLAAAVATLDFGKARSPAALAIWRMRDTAVAHGLHEPEPDDGPRREAAPNTARKQGGERSDTRTRAEWDSPARRDRMQRRLEEATGDTDIVQGRLGGIVRLGQSVIPQLSGSPGMPDAPRRDTPLRGMFGFQTKAKRAMSTFGVWPPCGHRRQASKAIVKK